MEKYAIKITKDNDSTILETFENKESAMAAGERYRSGYSRENGLISCILAEFNEENKMVGKGYRLIHAWF